MNIGLVVFDGFTDLDFYLPWDLLNRVRLMNLAPDWKVHILGDKPQFHSAAGLSIPVGKPYEFANQCDAVLFCSGPLTRSLIHDADFLSRFKLDSAKQVLAGIDSGSLILAALGHLKNKKATTYPTAFAELTALGANPVQTSFVEDGGIATASRCLSGDKLAMWMIEKLVGADIANKVFETVKPLS
jgi:transcriptional regulator GlxA family with amidase domain